MARTVTQLHLHLHVHFVEITGDRFVLRQFDFAQHFNHIGTKAPLIGEAGDLHRAVQQCGSRGVLQTEFSVEPRCGLRPVYILHDWRHHAHAPDILASAKQLVHVQTCGNAKVGAVLRWEQLDRQTGIHHAIRFAKRQQAIRIEVIGIKSGDQSFVRFEHIGVRGKTPLHQQCRIQPGSCGISAVGGFGH